MEHWKSDCILILTLTFVALVYAGKERFVCDSQITKSFQSDPPILVTWSGVFSSFACALLCKKSPNSCIAFHFTSAHDCYLYKEALSTVLLSDRLTCQLANYVSTTTEAASTAFSPQISTAASDASKTIFIKNVSYANFSCYPRQLFSGTSYYLRIPMAGGRDADCSCRGGLYLENEAYVNETALNTADCFAACEAIPFPPCKAFSFMEANNTCIIAPNSNNGDSTAKGVLQCYI